MGRMEGIALTLTLSQGERGLVVGCGMLLRI